MKYIIIPKEKKDITEYKNKGAEAFIFGLESYSVNYPEVSLEEIKELSKDNNLFISINKNIFNNELTDLKEKLIELSKLNIKGVLFYDLGLLNLVIENHINIDLVWHQTHMVTNYNTCNYYYDKNVKYGYLANEITLDEKLEIANKTKMKLMTQVFGYPAMANSRRSLLTNYFKSKEKSKDKTTYKLEDNLGQYIIKENETGTSVLFRKIINGTKPLFSLINSKIEYGVLDTQLIDTDICLKVLTTFLEISKKEITNLEKQQIIDYTNNLIGDYTGFYYQKTIYKVKKNDK